MDTERAHDWEALLGRQRGVISRTQAHQHGLDDMHVRRRLRSGTWRLLHQGVYTTFSGEPGREAVLWAALLRAGPGAVLSHDTAAELLGLADGRGVVVHVTVPADRHPESFRGVRLHRSSRIAWTAHPAGLPPRTRLEETVLDLADAAASLDDACDWVLRAVGRRLTTAFLLQAALGERSRARWRAGLMAAVTEAGAGAQSHLEHRYARDVERAHALPAAARQVRVTMDGKPAYLDNFYEAARLVVELDGERAHGLERRRADTQRDNAHTALGMVTLRYSYADVTGRPCAVARQVAQALCQRGTPVTPRPCSPTCTASP